MVAQMIASFGYRCLGRSQGARNRTKGLSAPLVPLVVRIQQADKRACI
jgi:hypothetical protein